MEAAGLVRRGFAPVDKNFVDGLTGSRQGVFVSSCMDMFI